MPFCQLLLHDLSKLSSAECESYVRSFHKRTKVSDAARAHHLSHNKHHWQSWAGKAMPEDYVAEMVADWIARCAISGDWDLEKWIKENTHDLHWLTKQRLHKVLDYVRRLHWQ